MTGEHLDAILKSANVSFDKGGDKGEKDGYSRLPEGTSLTFYAAHEGVSLTVPRVEALKLDGELIYARTSRGERFVLARSDLFAVAIDGAVVGSTPARRAGFG